MLLAENIFHFKLTLTGSRPEIWRRVLVPDECTLGDLHYVLSLLNDWPIDVQFEGGQAPVPRGHYPCCIAGANDRPPDGVGGVSRHNEVVQAFHNPEAWKALCDDVGSVEWRFAFEPAYLDIGDINTALGLIFRVDEEGTIAPTSSIAAR